MKICVVGDGIAGRTLARALKEAGHKVEIFGRRNRTACGVRSCGWGTSGSCIRLLARLIDYPVHLTLRHDSFVILDDRRIKGDLYSVDKPKLLKALYPDVRYETPEMDNYDLMIDATGISRALMPPAQNDKQARNYQLRVRTGVKIYPSFHVIKGGYLWTIPLGENEAHVGGGSAELPDSEIRRLVRERVEEYGGEVICSCHEAIRLSGLILPPMKGKVVAVGESVGTVVPFGGAGIHPSIEAALILAGHIVKGDLLGYHDSLRRRFGWLNGAREIIDSLPQLPVFSLPLSYRALRYQGLRPSMGDLLYIRKKLTEANRKWGEKC